jgi:hypothetical protein
MLALTSAIIGTLPAEAEGIPFACGLYGVEPAHFAEVASAGFNVVHTYRFETWAPPSVDAYVVEVRAYLDAAESAGLRGLIGVPRQWFLTRDAGSLRAAVLALKSHPALLAWYEEEQGQQGRVDAVIFLDEVVTAADPEHGLVIEENRRRTELLAAGRVRMFTYYPVSPQARRAGRLPSVLERLPKQPLLTPYWPVLQAYGQNLIAGCPKSDLVMPTRQELQYSLYSAIVHGAAGVFFYTYWHPSRFDAKRGQKGRWPYVDYRTLPELSPTAWGDVRATAREAQVLFETWRSREAASVPVDFKSPAGLESAQWEDNGEVMLILANSHCKPQTIRVAVPSNYRSWAILHATGLGPAQSIQEGRIAIEVPGPGGLAGVFSP